MSFLAKNFARRVASKVQASASTARVLARRPMATMAAGPTGGAARPASAAPTGKSSFRKNWLSDSATYPIMLIIGAACSMVILAGGRTLLFNPDVHFEKGERMDMLSNNDEEGESHYGHALRRYAMNTEGATQPMYRLNKAGWESKMKHDA